MGTIILVVLAIISLVDGLTVLTQAKSAIHQILGYIALVASSIFITGAVINVTISKIKNN